MLGKLFVQIFELGTNIFKKYPQFTVTKGEEVLVWQIKVCTSTGHSVQIILKIWKYDLYKYI